MNALSFGLLCLTGLLGQAFALPSPEARRIPTGPGPDLEVVSLPGYNNQLHPVDSHMGKASSGQDDGDDEDVDEAENRAQDKSDWTFNQTCSQLTLIGDGKKGQTSLVGNCRDQDGVWWQTSLNLNLCFENDAGVLQYQDSGNFDDECYPCMISNDKTGQGLDLKCNCLDSDGVPQYTSIGMGPEFDDTRTVKAVAGRLICGDQIGNKSPNFSP